MQRVILFRMEIVRSDALGFCFGVEYALQKAARALETYRGKNVYTLGSLIHNKQALEKLLQNGLRMLGENDIDKIENEAVVIVRAHGMPVPLLKKLGEKNCIVIDATCPHVKRSQHLVKQFSEKKYTIVFAGDKNHAEAISVASFANGNFTVIENANEAHALSFGKNESVLLLSQTTFSLNEFTKIAEELSKKEIALSVVNTVCKETVERQNALADLCKTVRAVIVAGDKKSANTKRLAIAARSYGVLSCIAENENEIPEEYFSFSKVGLASGASTSSEAIAAIEKRLYRHAI